MVLDSRRGIERTEPGACQVPGTNKLKRHCQGRSSRSLPNRSGLVTGVGRSGTHTTSALFLAAGLDLRHERVGRDGSVAWPMALSATDGGCRWLRPPGVLFERVVHLTRCPISSISSLTTSGKCSLDFMMHGAGLAIPELAHNGDQPLLSQRISRSGRLVIAARLWLGWSTLVEKQADAYVQVEGLASPAEVRRLCTEAVGSDPRCENMANLRVGRIRSNHGEPRDHLNFSFAELTAADPALAKRVRAFGERHGYGAECFGGTGAARQFLVDIEAVPGATAVALGRNATAQRYRRRHVWGLPGNLTDSAAGNGSVAQVESIAGSRAGENEELCTCWDGRWTPNDGEDDDLGSCLCVDARAPRAMEMLAMARS